MPSPLESIRGKYQTALADHERRVILDILTAEVTKMTLGELGEILTSELGAPLKSVAARELFNAVSELRRREAGLPRLVPMDVPPGPPPTGEIRPSAQPKTPSTPKSPRSAGSAKSITDDVRRTLEASPRPMSPRELRTATGHPEAKVKQAIRFFLQQGVVKRSGVGRGTLYYLASRATGGSSASAVSPTSAVQPSPDSAPKSSSGVVRRRPPGTTQP